jgi:hypothetical protein
MNLSVTESLALAHDRLALNGDLVDAPRGAFDALPKKDPAYCFQQAGP